MVNYSTKLNIIIIKNKIEGFYYLLLIFIYFCFPSNVNFFVCFRKNFVIYNFNTKKKIVRDFESQSDIFDQLTREASGA